MALLAAARLITGSLRLDAALEEVRRLAAGARGLDWELVLNHADGHTLAPLLWSVWRAAGALDALPEAARARLERAYAGNARRNQNIRAELLEIHGLLAQAGAPHLVLKGWPLVERLYADPAERYMSDHDFLVPAEQAQAGHRALLAAGFRPLPAKDEWIEKHLPSVWRNPGYVWDGYLYDPDYPRPVELHIRLWERGWRGLRVRDLSGVWERAQEQVVADVPMRVLGVEDALVHLAMHFAGHLVEREARLNQLLDLARWAQRAGPDWERCAALAAQANVGRFVYASLYLAHAIFGAPLPPARVWGQLAEATPVALRRWLDAEGVADTLTADYRRPARRQEYRLTFLAAASLAERLGIVRFAALPPLDQLAAKYGLRRRWLAPFYYPRHLAERALAYGLPGRRGEP